MTMHKNDEPTSFLGAYLKAGMLVALVIGSVWVFHIAGDLYKMTKARLNAPPQGAN